MGDRRDCPERSCTCRYPDRWAQARWRWLKLKGQAVLTVNWRPMARLIIPQRLELFVVTTQSTISRECLCQRPVRKVLQRRASRTAVIRHRQLSSTECTIASDTDACTRSLSISRLSRGDGQRPSCSRAMKRGGSWHISPTCQTYESPTSNFPVGSRSIADRARHAPVIICLVES